MLLAFLAVWLMCLDNAFRLDVARNNFCNRVVSLWNGLPEHAVTAASLTLFKKYLRTIDFSSNIKFDRNL